MYLPKHFLVQVRVSFISNLPLCSSFKSLMLLLLLMLRMPVVLIILLSVIKSLIMITITSLLSHLLIFLVLLLFALFFLHISWFAIISHIRFCYNYYHYYCFHQCFVLFCFIFFSDLATSFFVVKFSKLLCLFVFLYCFLSSNRKVKLHNLIDILQFQKILHFYSFIAFLV